MSTPRRTTLLAILDGFGHREAAEDNAIRAANTPNLDRLWRDASNTLVSGSGLDVGLPEGQMGNSEVGHMSLGPGGLFTSRLLESIRRFVLVTSRPMPLTCRPSTRRSPLTRPFISWDCSHLGVFTAMKNTCLRLSGLPRARCDPNLFTRLSRRPGYTAAQRSTLYRAR